MSSDIAPYVLLSAVCDDLLQLIYSFSLFTTDVIFHLRFIFQTFHVLSRVITHVQS